MRTGSCKFGTSCKYHHPRQGASSANPFALNIYGYPLRPVCKLFMIIILIVVPRVYGVWRFEVYEGWWLLIVQGEKECSYYIKTGQCKFGMTCKFHHPPPCNVPVPTATPATVPPAPLSAATIYSTPSPAPQQYGMVTGNWPLVRPSMLPGSYIQGPYGPMLISPGVLPFPGWPPYPVSVFTILSC